MAEAELLVCVKCRAGREIPDDGQRPGELLADRLMDARPEGLRVIPVECMSNCDHGCSVAFRGEGRWTFVYGNFTEDDAALVAEGATLYAGTPDGLVPWRSRPEHFKRNCIARIPPLTTATATAPKEAAE
ncbi:DUF1636 family protein [Palleronia caenipelagi]|uniref:DUF1636 domain-containing protein n=1 Tax=Palleronia caenipelagi TaxID=2489174 RepID=A0A547Q8G1_9RHOB|nr:DUF1636 domain-containing protein [Palleronia caenipelagi]TRD22675.1 DUF1636 domain-containing protein [Palleronia caenipelagi]